MKIAVLTNAYPPNAEGGAGRIAEIQVGLLREAGHEVRVWHSAAAWRRSHVAPIVRLFHHLRDLWPQASVVQEIGAWKPDVLLSHNLTGVGFATPRHIQSRGIRWVHVLHDVQLFEPSGLLRSDARVTCWQRLWSALRRRAFGTPDQVVSPTRWLLLAHRRRGMLGASPAAIVPNPGPTPDARAPRIRHTPLRVAFVGRLSEEKGTRLLVSLLEGMNERVALTFVGDGPDRAFLERTFPQATFYGSVDPERVREVMRMQDVLVMCSVVCENQPTVLLEAMSVGLPVLTTRVGGIPETCGEDVVALGEPFAQAVTRLRAELEALLDVSDDVYTERVERMRALSSRYHPARHLAALVEVLKS